MIGNAVEIRPAPVQLDGAGAAPPQTPSVGRIVLYRPTAAEREGSGQSGECWPAIITNVWSPTCVNLHVLADAGPAFFVTSVAAGTADRSWRWPPRV